MKSMIIGFGYRDNGSAAAAQAIMSARGSSYNLKSYSFPEAYNMLDRFAAIKVLKAAILRDQPTVALIDNVSNRNEVRWIMSERGVVVRIERVGDPHQDAHELDSFEDFAYTLQVADLGELWQDAVKLFDLIVESLNPPFTDFTEAAFDGSARAEDHTAVSSGG